MAFDPPLRDQARLRFYFGRALAADLKLRLLNDRHRKPA
jgi:hypothetical protein